MIAYVHQRLNLWGDWVARGRNEGRNGYPRQTSFARLMPSSGASPWSPLLDVEAEEIDQCVRRLDVTRRDLVTRYYTRTITSAQLSREMGCCEKTLFNRMSIAHNEILGWLNDLAAGIELPPVTGSKALRECFEKTVVDTDYSEH